MVLLINLTDNKVQKTVNFETLWEGDGVELVSVPVSGLLLGVQ